MYKNTLPLIILSLLLIFSSCSKDDNSNENNYFLNVEVQNAKLSSDAIGLFSFDFDECQTSEYLTSTSIGQIETSKYWIDAFLFHYQDSYNFSPSINKNSQVIEFNTSTSYCAENFNFFLNFSLNDNYLALDKSSNNTNTITDISLVSENSQEITYAISGNFNLTFINVDNTTVAITGKYRVPTIVLK